MEKETLEEFAERLCPNKQVEYDMIIEGAKWQQERSYSEEDIRNAIDYGAELGLSEDIGNSFEWTRKKDLWFEQFKKK